MVVPSGVAGPRARISEAVSGDGITARWSALGSAVTPVDGGVEIACPCELVEAAGAALEAGAEGRLVATLSAPVNQASTDTASYGCGGGRKQET